MKQDFLPYGRIYHMHLESDFINFSFKKFLYLCTVAVKNAQYLAY